MRFSIRYIAGSRDHQLQLDSHHRIGSCKGCSSKSIGSQFGMDIQIFNPELQDFFDSRISDLARGNGCMGRANTCPPTGTLKAVLSHVLIPAPIRLWPHFFYRTSTSSVHHSTTPHDTNHRNLPRLSINLFQNGVRAIDPQPTLAMARTVSFDPNGHCRARTAPNITSYENPSLTFSQPHRR